MEVWKWKALCNEARYSHEQSSASSRKLFSCSTQLSMKFSLLINTCMKMSTIVGIFIHYLLAEKSSCSAMYSKIEFAIVNNLRLISRTKFMLSWVQHEKSFITSGPESHDPKLGVLAIWPPGHFYKAWNYSTWCRYNSGMYMVWEDI